MKTINYLIYQKATAGICLKRAGRHAEVGPVFTPGTRSALRRAFNATLSGKVLSTSTAEVNTAKL